MMKLLKPFFVFALYCSTIGYTFAQTTTFDIEVLQSGKTLPVGTNHEIKLKRAPFVLKIRLKGIDAIYCQAGFSDSMFVKPANSAIAQFTDIPAMSMAEEQFNAERALIIRSEAWHCWFYDPQLDWHRFDKEHLSVKGNEVIAFKTIEQLLIIDDADFNEPQRFHRKLIEPNPDLYLFFFSALEQNGALIKESDRYALRLSWID